MLKRRLSLAFILLALLATSIGQPVELRAQPPETQPPGPQPTETPSKEVQPKEVQPTEAPPADAKATPSEPSDYELYKLLIDTLEHVDQHYVKEVDRRELVEAAIQGMLDKLDRHSGYIGPREIDGFRRTVEGQFGGLGIQVRMDQKKRLKVFHPMRTGPAYRAGVRAGDWIKAVDGESLKGLPMHRCVEKLKGSTGSKVKLTIVRPDTDGEREIVVAREKIQIDTVRGDHRNSDDSWDFMLDDEKRIGYVRLTAFSRETAKQLGKALEQLSTDNVRGLILDLRFNPGGLLSSAIEVADLFIEQGRIVSTEGRSSPKREWDAKGPGTFDDIPLVVLVNRYSASASEVLSACLQDHGRAVVIGERTYGKGSVQNVIPLEGGRSALKLTTSAYRRPSGKNIHRFRGAKEKDEWGVTPDDGYLIKLSAAEIKQLVDYHHQRDSIPLELLQEERRREKEQAERDEAEQDEQAQTEQAQPENTQPDNTQADNGQQAGDPPADAHAAEAADEGDAAAVSPAEGNSTPAEPADEPPTDEGSAGEQSADEQVTDEPTPEEMILALDRQLRMAVGVLDAEFAKADDGD